MLRVTLPSWDENTQIFRRWSVVIPLPIPTHCYFEMFSSVVRLKPDERYQTVEDKIQQITGQLGFCVNRKREFPFKRQLYSKSCYPNII